MAWRRRDLSVGLYVPLLEFNHTDGRFAPYGGRHCRSKMQWLPPSSSSLACSLSLRCCCASFSPSKARIAASRCVEPTLSSSGFGGQVVLLLQKPNQVAQII